MTIFAEENNLKCKRKIVPILSHPQGVESALLDDMTDNQGENVQVQGIYSFQLLGWFIIHYSFGYHLLLD